MGTIQDHLRPLWILLNHLGQLKHTWMLAVTQRNAALSRTPARGTFTVEVWWCVRHGWIDSNKLVDWQIEEKHFLCQTSLIGRFQIKCQYILILHILGTRQPSFLNVLFQQLKRKRLQWPYKYVLTGTNWTGVENSLPGRFNLTRN